MECCYEERLLLIYLFSRDEMTQTLINVHAVVASRRNYCCVVRRTLRHLSQNSLQINGNDLECECAFLCRLVMYIERDSRRQAPGKLENQHAHMEYLGRCMELLVSTLVHLLPDLTREHHTQ